MTDGIDFRINGLEELQGKLRGLSDDVQRKGGRFALRKAAQVIRDQVRQNASLVDDPATPENIAKNIVERWSNRTFRRTGNLMFRIGVLGGARSTGGGSNNPGGDTFYWRFIELGTSKMAAQPFLRPAIQQSGQQALNTFSREYIRAAERAIRRARRAT